MIQAKSSLLDVARTVAQIQKSHGLPVAEDEYQNSFKFGLMEVVYEWARGMVRATRGSNFSFGIFH
jgi:antiviral helicase SKI2